MYTENQIDNIPTPTIGITQRSLSDLCLEYTQLKQLQLQVKAGKEKEKEFLALVERSKYNLI
jgi:hypothetical protein